MVWHPPLKRKQFLVRVQVQAFSVGSLEAKAADCKSSAHEAMIIELLMFYNIKLRSVLD